MVLPLWKGFMTPPKAHAYLLDAPCRFVSIVKLFLTLRKLARTYKEMFQVIRSKRRQMGRFRGHP